MKSHSIILVLLLAFQAVSRAQDRSAYQLFDKTTSPDKHYAVAWAVPGHPEKKTSAAIDDPDSVENYLVDLRTQKIVTSIKGCRYFPDQNHDDIQVAWSPDSRFAAVIYSGKWTPIGVFVLGIPKTGVTSQADITAQIRGDVFHWLDHKGGQGYRKAKAKVTLTLKPCAIEPDHGLHFPVSVYVPKQEKGWTFDGMLVYGLRIKSGQVIATYRWLGWYGPNDPVGNSRSFNIHRIEWQLLAKG